MPLLLQVRGTLVVPPAQWWQAVLELPMPVKTALTRAHKRLAEHAQLPGVTAGQELPGVAAATPAQPTGAPPPGMSLESFFEQARQRLEAIAREKGWLRDDGSLHSENHCWLIRPAARIVSPSQLRWICGPCGRAGQGRGADGNGVRAMPQQCWAQRLVPYTSLDCSLPLHSLSVMYCSSFSMRRSCMHAIGNVHCV
jgi:hypothetical protein